MAGEWVNCTLGDVLTLQRGFDLPAQDRKPGPYPIIASTGEVGTHSEKMVRAPGVVIGRSGSLGGGQFITRDFWPLNTTLWVKDFQGNDPRFCFYLLTSIDFGQFNVGGAVPTLNRNHIHPLPVYVPRDISEQRAIAHILGTLDDKIELNQRMNETLEAMARALFKSWFVDFDPVRAKAERRDPGLPKPLADMFPDSFEDSELGEIPKGWVVGAISDFATLNPEAWSKDTRPSVINYVDLSNTKWGRIEEVTAYAQKEAPSRAQRVLRSKDTILGTVRPGNGSYALISQDGLTGSTGFAVLTPLKAEYAEFVYFAATAADNIDRLAHLADGAAYPAVRPEVVAATQALKAPDGISERFSRITGPLLEKVAENERESRSLATIRDTLLPKLISGELRVGKAEQILWEVV
jgi:type I restriction enzyme S subunit